MIDVKVVGLNDYLHSRKCRVCGETFSFYPAFHQWLAKVDGHHDEPVCRYSCMRKVERELEQKRKERADYARTTVYRRPKPIAWYTREKGKCEKKIAEYTEKIQALQESGEWSTITATERKRLKAKRLYYTDRAAVLAKEIERLQEKGYEE